MSKLSNLLEKDLKIVEKRKFIFLVPICILIIAIICGVIFRFTMGSAFNLGMDFAGGYTINVDIGSKLNDSNVDEYKEIVKEIVEEYSNEEGKSYGIKATIYEYGEGDDKSLQVRFKSVDNDDTMEVVVAGIIEKLKDRLTVIRPKVEIVGNKVTVEYDEVLNKSEIEAKIGSISGASLTGIEYDNTDKKVAKKASFNVSSTPDQASIETAMSFKDTFSARPYEGGKVGATVSQDLLYNALSAIIIALVLMLVYIAIRFEFKSGVAAIVALMHDLMVMFAFMVIFHVEFNSTFIAALITILGYSINNSIILFDRVRSNIKLNLGLDANALANKSITQSFVRCLNTTITTAIMIGSVAIVCAIASIFNPDLYQMVTFSLPIIVGLLSGFFSAMFIAPSIWVSLDRDKNISVPKAQPAEVKE